MILILFNLLYLEQCIGQIIDIGAIWETHCPQGCSCEMQKFADLPLHQWTNIGKTPEGFPLDSNHFNLEIEHSMFDELLKVATCVVAEDFEDLFSKLPLDIQVFTILESGNGDIQVPLQATTLQRFTQLIALDIQGIYYNPPITAIENGEKKTGGITLSTDALFPLGTTLLYLNLERVKLTSLTGINKNKANLIITPMNASNNENTNEGHILTDKVSHYKGHRLIFLSQQNNADSDDKEILPYDIYKQEVEGYRDTIGLFSGLGALTHLRVYDCALKDVSWHMFDGLNNLIYLSLEKNNLKFIPEFCFYGTPNLKSLSLASNQLLTLQSVDLAGLLMLEQLDLRGNNLTFLSELSFPPFPALNSADFTENPLDSVFPSTFEIMNTTMQLYLGGTGSRLKLQKNSLLGLHHLQILHLYNLEILVLERFILQGMPLLTQLKIHGNVSSIDFDAFVDLRKLVDLDLSYCHIQRISMDAFYGLKHVQRIDLSNNELTFIPPGLLTVQQQQNLKEIILTKNKLTTLPWDFFKSLRVANIQQLVQNIRLDGNPWDCTCSMMNWNPYLVNRFRETAPRCYMPKHLRNWGVFHALRKGGLHCERPRNKQPFKFFKTRSFEDNEVTR